MHRRHYAYHSKNRDVNSGSCATKSSIYVPLRCLLKFISTQSANDIEDVDEREY